MIELVKYKSAFLLFFILIALSLHGSSVSLAAVVDGDDIVRYVDTPTGTILYKGTAIDTSPVYESSSSDEMPSMDMPSNLTPIHKSSNVSEEIPEEPVFNSEVETPVQKHKSNNTLFLVIGAIVIIIGVGIILFIAKSREKE